MNVESSQPIRVAQVVNNLHYGGLERVVQDLIRCFRPEEVESHLVLLEYDGHYAAGLDGLAQLHRLPPMSKLSLLQPVALTRLLERVRPDVLHSHSGVWFKAARAGRLARVPAQVHTDHGRAFPDPQLHRWLDRLASRYCDAVVAVSDSVADRLHSGIVPRHRRMEVIANGIDTTAFRPRGGALSLRRELGIPDQASVIGSIGRLEPVKNYELAIQALRHLITIGKPGEPPPHLVLAGDGSSRSALEREIRSHGLESRVHLLGWQDDTEALLDTFDLFTLTSRSEGTSMSLLEAMSCELPCVVTDVGGNRAVLGPALKTALVPSDDLPALSLAWSRMLNDAAERDRFGRLARVRVVEAFSSQRMAENYLTLYRDLLHRTASSRRMAG